MSTLYQIACPMYLFDLCQLLPASSDIIISDLVESLFLILSLDWLSLTVNHSVRGYNAVGGGVSLNNLEGNNYYSEVMTITKISDQNLCN